MPAALTMTVPEAGKLYWRAFQVLDQQRGAGGGPAGGPLPLSYQAMRDYARDHGLVLDDAVTVLQMLDAEYFAVYGERMRAMRAQAEKTSERR